MAPKTRAKSAKAGAEDANPKQPKIKSKFYKLMHVFKYTDRWGAWVREPKRGGDCVFLGTHLTDRLAARCQDRALLKLETEPTMTRPVKLNFKRTDYAEDEELRQNKTRVEFIEQLQRESRACYKKLEPTACLLKFLTEEVALGNIPTNSLSDLANSKNKSADEEIDEPSDYDETDEEEPEKDEDDSSDDDEPEDHPKDTETAFQDTANAEAVAANASAEPLDSGEAADPRKPAKVLAPAELSEWNRRRLRSELPTEEELEVANFLVTEDFRSRWASGSASDDVLVAAATMVQLKRDPNYSAPVQKESRPKRKQTRRGRRS